MTSWPLRSSSGLDEHLDLVTDLQVRIVTELRGGNDTFALGADVHDDLALVDGRNHTLDHLVLGDLLQGLVVLGGNLCAVLTGGAVVLESIPVELFRGYGSVQHSLLGFFLDGSLHFGNFNLRGFHLGSFFHHVFDFF